MTATELTVFYDADCGVCRLTSVALARLDWRRRLAFVPLQRFTGAAPTTSELAHELHVRDASGRWWRGGGAALRIARAIPLLMPVAVIGRLPGMRLVVDASYRLVAAHRPAISRALRLTSSGRSIGHSLE